MKRIGILALFLCLATMAGAKKSAGPVAVDTRTPKEIRLDELYAKGQQIYQLGDLPRARSIFEEMLLINPEEPRAATYLNSTQEEWMRYLDEKAMVQGLKDREEQAQNQLREPARIQTKVPTDLADFLDNLSFATGMNFNISPGVQAKVNAKFIDTPLNEILDAILLPIGLRWEYANAVVSIFPALQTRIFNLTPSELARVKVIYDEKMLHRVLWDGQTMPQLQGESLLLEARASRLIAVDSKQRLDKLATLLKDIDRSFPPGLETRMYKIDADLGAEIKALIDAAIRSESESVFDLERKVYIEGSHLIVREEPDKIVEIEKMLRNQKLLNGLATHQLKIGTFNLIPRESIKEEIDYLKNDVIPNMIGMVETYLYSQTTKSVAISEGRRLWYDPNALSLVLIDTPARINDVATFIGALPYYEQKDYMKLVYVKHLDASDLEGEILNQLGLDGGAGADAETENSITKSLRREDEFEWRDLTIVVRRVNENDFNDDMDDSVDLTIRIRGAQSQSQTFIELETTQNMADNVGGDYEIYCEEVRPSGTNGDGRATIQITYTPPITN